MRGNWESKRIRERSHLKEKGTQKREQGGGGERDTGIPDKEV